MKNYVKTCIAAGFWLAMWYIAAAVVGKPLLLPYPHQVAVRMIMLLPQKEFLMSAFMSLIRMSAGILIGIMIGILLAFLTAKAELAEIIISPFMSVIRATPVASFIVLLLLWIGRGMLPGLISAMVVVPIIWSNVLQGIRGVNRELEEMAYMYRFSIMKRLKYLLIPNIKPYFMAASRTALGMGWKSGVAAEVLAVPTLSIGKHIFESKLYMETTDLFAWTVFVIALSIIVEKSVFLLFDRNQSRRRGKQL